MIDIKFSEFKTSSSYEFVEQADLCVTAQFRATRENDGKRIPSEKFVQTVLLSSLSTEMNSGIRDTISHTLMSLHAVRGSSESCDKALAVACAELHSVIELLNSGMHLLRVDKMLGGSGD